MSICVTNMSDMKKIHHQSRLSLGNNECLPLLQEFKRPCLGIILLSNIQILIFEDYTLYHHVKKYDSVS